MYNSQYYAANPKSAKVVIWACSITTMLEYGAFTASITVFEVFAFGMGGIRDYIAKVLRQSVSKLSSSNSKIFTNAD